MIDGKTATHRITLRGGEGVYRGINAMLRHPLRPAERLRE